MTAAGFFSSRHNQTIGLVGSSGRSTSATGNRPTLLSAKAMTRLLARTTSRIAFLLHASVEAGMGGAVMTMRADGSSRPHHDRVWISVLVSIRPRTSDQQLLTPQQIRQIFNLEAKQGRVIEVPDHQVFSWPSWVGPRTVVTSLAPKEASEGDSIVLLDVSEPAEAKILEVLWSGTGISTSARVAGLPPRDESVVLRRRRAEKEGGPPERRSALLDP